MSYVKSQLFLLAVLFIFLGCNSFHTKQALKKEKLHINFDNMPLIEALYYERYDEAESIINGDSIAELINTNCEIVARDITWNGRMKYPGYEYCYSALHLAAYYGNERIVKLLLEKGADPFVPKGQDNVKLPVYYAILGGHKKIVKLLSKIIPDVNTNYGWLEAINIACRSGDLDLVCFFLSKGWKVNAYQSYPLASPLSSAAETGQEEIVRVLIKEGAQINGKSKLPSQPSSLYMAACGGHLKIVQTLLQNGAAIDLGTMLETPLTGAAANGHNEIVLELLKNGADINGIGNQDKKPATTPLNRAASNAHYNVVKTLLDYGANIEGLYSFDKDKPTPLWDALNKGSESIMRLLIQQGADTHLSWKYERTFLQLAVYRGFSDIIQLLIEKGARQNTEEISLLHFTYQQQQYDIFKFLIRDYPVHLVDIKPLFHILAGKQEDYDYLDLIVSAIPENELNNTMLTQGLWEAVKHNNIAAATLLTKKGVDVNDREADYGSTPICVALGKGYVEMVELLLNAGADLFIQNDRGISPLHYAYKYGKKATFRKMIDLCLSRGYSLYNELFLCFEMVLNEQFSILEKHNFDFSLLNKANYPVIALSLLTSRDPESLSRNLSYGFDPNILLYRETDKIWKFDPSTRVERKSLSFSGDVENTQLWITPLECCFESPHFYYDKEQKYNLVRQLLEAGADSNQSPHNLLFYAIRNDNKKIFDMLLEYGTDPNRPYHIIYFPLLAAIARKHKDFAERLLSLPNIDCNVLNQDGETALMIAIKAQHYEMAIDLIPRTNNISHRSNYGMTAFYWALRVQYNAKLLKLLLEYTDEDINTPTKFGTTALFFTNELDKYLLIKDNITNIDHRNVLGQTALIDFCLHGKFPVVQELIKLGADVNAMNDEGWTPLYCAIHSGNWDLIKYLLDHGARVNPQTDSILPAIDALIKEIPLDQDEYVKVLEMLLIYKKKNETPKDPVIGKILELFIKGELEEALTIQSDNYIVNWK